MDIKSIRLKNFKGFKDAKLELKPLTVLLGPNSSGKSCFGQALVALSKSNAEDKTLSLKFDPKSSVEFGDYKDLIHDGSTGENVTIKLELSLASIELGFGSGNAKAKIPELELSLIKILEQNLAEDHMNISGHETLDQDSISQSISTSISASDIAMVEAKEIKRINTNTWEVSAANEPAMHYTFTFDGILIDNISKLTGTAIPVDSIVSREIFERLSSSLRSISYLRPDREAPLRMKEIPTKGAFYIDDKGLGTDWFIFNKKTMPVQTFTFPRPSVDKEKSKIELNDYEKAKPEDAPLIKAINRWLKQLGLAEDLDVALIDHEGLRSTKTVAKPIGQSSARPLSDLGFGVSQALPILVKGLTMRPGDLLIVEQPEAQLHPKPQAELADFFCSMVKCNRNVVVETHSEELLHRLRLRAAMDKELAEKIGVYFLHEPQDGACCEPMPISLDEGDELKWPKGFLPDGMENELAIRTIRRVVKNNATK